MVVGKGRKCIMAVLNAVAALLLVAVNSVVIPVMVDEDGVSSVVLIFAK